MAGPMEKLVEGASELLDGVGFADEIANAHVQSFFLILGAHVAGGHDHWDIGADREYGSGKFETRHAGHVQIGDHGIETLRRGSKGFQGDGRLFITGEAVTQPLEGAREEIQEAWLIGHGAVPVNYGDDLPARLRAAAKSGPIAALLDFFGGGYVAMAIEKLQLPPERVDTIADFEAVKRFGVQSKGGSDAATAAVLAELADLIARGELEVPIAGVFALDDVREAFRQLELRHTRGKLVLRP
jgi:hypothetical protein